MMYAEWLRARKEWKERHPEHNATYCLICRDDTAADTFPVVYRVAELYYASESLDSVPGIDGPNRHEVLIEWLHANREQLSRDAANVEAAMSKAFYVSLHIIEASIPHLRLRPIS